MSLGELLNICMKFKQWLEDNFSGGTSMGYGGATEPANSRTNSNFPFGVRSRYQTMDREERDQQDTEKDRPNPDVSFGFQTPKQKKRALESQPKIIDKSRKAVPIRDDDMNITY